MFKKFLPILLLNFVNILGFSILIPVLPGIVKDFLGHSSGLLYGLLLASYSFCQLLAAPLLGGLSDKYGRRPILLLSQTGTLLSWLIFLAAAYVSTDIKLAGIPIALHIIGLSRIVDGLTGGNVSVSSAWVSDHSTAAEKSKAFGLMGASFGIGFLVGPALGGIAYDLFDGIKGVGIIAFLISLVTLIAIYFKLPESLAEENRVEEFKLDYLSNLNFFAAAKKLESKESLDLAIILRIGFSVCFVVFTTGIILFMERVFAMNPTQIGLFMSAIGIFSVFNQLVLVHRIGDRYGNFTSFVVANIFNGLFLIGISLSTFFYPGQLTITFLLGFLLLNLFLNLAVTVGMTNFKAYLANNASPRRQGLATGIDESISSFGRGIVPLFAGVLYDVIGHASFILCGATLSILSVIVYLKRK